MTALLLTLLLQALPSRPISGFVELPGRPYHKVTLDKVKGTRWTHIETCGKVVYKRKQKDGDWHITLSDGNVKVVLEIIPLIPLPAPNKGQTIVARGISRHDKGHDFAEIHPLESWEAVARCNK